MMEKENIKEQKNKIKGWNFNQPQECELCSLCSGNFLERKTKNGNKKANKYKTKI